jgi:serine protease DegQ
MRGSPADLAGVKPGDVLLTVAGKPIKDAQAMLELIAGLSPGEHTQIAIRRSAQDYTVDLVVGKRPPPRRD